jgi:hypothetical protein
MEEKYEFEFEPSKPIDGQKGVTFTSTVTPQSEEKGDPLAFPPAKKIAQTMMAPMKDAADTVVAVGGGAAIGTISRMHEIRRLVAMLISNGMSPEDAVSHATRQVTSGPTVAGSPATTSSPSISAVSDVRVKDPFASGAANYGEKMPGSKLPDVVKATIEDMTTGKNPRGLGAGDVAARDAENLRRISSLGEGNTRLFNVNGTQLMLTPEQAAAYEQDLAAKAKPSAAQSATNKVKSAASSIGRGLGTLGEWSATTPGFVGKLLGGLGGAAAGYQGYEAIKALKAAENNPERLQAIYDIIAAGASGAAALPIPAAQLPGLALGIGIPAAGYLGRKISGALPDFGISEEAKRAVR